MLHWLILLISFIFKLFNLRDFQDLPVARETNRAVCVQLQETHCSLCRCCARSVCCRNSSTTSHNINMPATRSMVSWLCFSTWRFGPLQSKYVRYFLVTVFGVSRSRFKSRTSRVEPACWCSVFKLRPCSDLTFLMKIFVLKIYRVWKFVLFHAVKEATCNPLT